MRCLACGAEMHLMHVVRDETMLVPGYEHRTFMCSACGDIERRLVFARDIGQSPTEPVPVHTAPPISPAPDQQDRVPTSGILRRLFAKLRGNQVSVRLAPPTSPAEPVPVNTTAHSSVPSEASSALPRRAIEMCPGSTCHSQPTESLTDEGPRILAEPAICSVSPTPVSCESDKNLDECEVLLRRAIELVRGRTRCAQKHHASQTHRLRQLVPCGLRGPLQAASSCEFIMILRKPNTLHRTLRRVCASCGTKTARAYGRCVIGWGGR